MAKPNTKAFQALFEEVDKLNPSASYLSEENSLSIVNDWIDTGSYALNAIFSGSLFKGIPVGRITGFSGPSQSGKTLIINKIIANAQKRGYFAAIWDTEAAVDRQSAENVGVDTSRVRYYPVETVEDCRNQVATFLDKMIAVSDPDLKVIIAIDSLGNLASAKELNDVAQGKDAADMGSKAKAMKSMMRVLTYKAAKARVPILFTNHTYDNPTAMYPELVKRTSGGSGPIFLASLLVQLATRHEKIDKNEDQKSIAIAHNVSGVTLSALTVKNRFVPPYLKAELYNNFRTGLDKYAGLADMVIAMGVVTGEKTYEYNGQKLGYRKNWENNTELWEKTLLSALENKLQKEIRYNDPSEAAIVEETIEADTSEA